MIHILKREQQWIFQCKPFNTSKYQIMWHHVDYEWAYGLTIAFSKTRKPGYVYNSEWFHL